VHNANPAAPGGEPVFTGWCLDKEDLCVAKLCAFREKDRDFVRALIDARLVDRAVIVDRLPTVPSRYRAAADAAGEWIASL
jgi:hypothetical protein